MIARSAASQRRRQAWSSLVASCAAPSTQHAVLRPNHLGCARCGSEAVARSSGSHRPARRTQDLALRLCQARPVMRAGTRSDTLSLAVVITFRRVLRFKYFHRVVTVIDEIDAVSIGYDGNSEQRPGAGC